MTDRFLPEYIAKAISTMTVSLSPESYKPLYYKTLEELTQIRDPECTHPIARDVVSTIRLIAGSRPSDDDEYLARCATALILLGHGATDEAHDLVSPLSWPNELPFAYGPAVNTSEEICTLASYIHAMVHRREGPFPSEFGMTGFKNAAYWAGSALKSPTGSQALPLEEFRTAIMDIASISHSNNSQVQQWVQKNVPDVDAFPVWDTRVLTKLCATIQDTPDKEMQEFTEQAVLAEMKVLLKHTLLTIGYSISGNL
jgi:hypothetical protein